MLDVHSTQEEPPIPLPPGHRCGTCWLLRWMRTGRWRGWRLCCARRTRGCGRRARSRRLSWSGCGLTWPLCSGWCSGGRQGGRGPGRLPAAGTRGRAVICAVAARAGRSGVRGRGRGGGITRTCPGSRWPGISGGGGYCCPGCGTPFTGLGSDHVTEQPSSPSRRHREHGHAARWHTQSRDFRILTVSKAAESLSMSRTTFRRALLECSARERGVEWPRNAPYATGDATGTRKVLRDAVLLRRRYEKSLM